jgi:cobalamin biosynthesis protein CobT
LARKAPLHDPEFFQQRRLPGKQSYFVGIGVDASGSTAGNRIQLAKQVAMAEAEMLNRLGIKFFVYCHSGSGSRSVGMSLDMYEIKAPDEPWNDKTRERLRRMSSQAANLDGHSIQFYRKKLEKRPEKTKILHYYSDGAMPCENYYEELTILQEEIVRFKRLGFILAGVGIQSDAPRQHGLPTVIVNEQKDVIKVVDDLQQWITSR